MSVNLYISTYSFPVLYLQLLLIWKFYNWEVRKVFSSFFYLESDGNKIRIYKMSSSRKALEPAFQGAGQKPYP